LSVDTFHETVIVVLLVASAVVFGGAVGACVSTAAAVVARTLLDGADSRPEESIVISVYEYVVDGASPWSVQLVPETVVTAVPSRTMR
jgi:hypothetical protein